MSEKNKGGRPSTYKPEYCAALVEHMKQGYSFEAFGGVIVKSVDTLYAWLKAHDEFSEAKKEGEVLCRIWWEKMGHAGLTGKLKNFNATVWIFSMKNRFHWRDKQEMTGKDGGPIENSGKIEVVITNLTKK